MTLVRGSSIQQTSMNLLQIVARRRNWLLVKQQQSYRYHNTTNSFVSLSLRVKGDDTTHCNKFWDICVVFVLFSMFCQGSTMLVAALSCFQVLQWDWQNTDSHRTISLLVPIVFSNQPRFLMVSPWANLDSESFVAMLHWSRWLDLQHGREYA